MFTRVKGFFEKLPSQRIYIIPTKQGFSFVLIGVTISLIGLIYENNSILLIGFSLFFVFIYHAFMTNGMLEGLEFEHFYSLKQSVHPSIDFQVLNKKNRKFKLYFKATLQNKMFEDRIHELDSLESKKTSIGFSGLPRGVYELKQLISYNKFPLGLFYSWRVVRFEKLEIYSYPERKGIALDKNLHSSFIETHKESKRSYSDQTYKEHRKYEQGDSLSRIDWKHFAKTGNLYVSVYESNAQKVLAFRLKNTPTEEEISQVAYWIEQAFHEGLSWDLSLNNKLLEGQTGQKGYYECLGELAKI